MDCREYKSKFADIEKIVDNVTKKNVTILIHKNPDGDAMGSALALSLWLQKKNLNVKIVSTNYFSDIYMWMPNTTNVLVYESIFKASIVEYIKKSELIFCVDFNQKERVSDEIWQLVSGNLKKKICVIDHHPHLQDFDCLLCLDTSVTSTCEILYNLFWSSKKNIINDNIATCLYVGIFTDTAKFTTPNVTYKTHMIVADIIKKYNINVGFINKQIYGSNSLKRMRFLGYVLHKKLKIVKDYNVAYIGISLNETSKYFLKPGDTDGIVNYALSLKNVALAAMFNEKKDGIYISFRSVGDFSVNEFAKENFNGGGHKNAAGGFSNLTLEKTIDNFIKLIKNFDILKTWTKEMI